MFDQMTRTSREIVTRGMDEAHALGSTTIEAEHLLAALAMSTGPVGGVLAQEGLTADRVRDLIREERSRSLASAGIRAPSPAPTEGDLPLSTSAKAVLRRAVAASRGSITDVTMATAVLGQEAGTVPRLLAIAGVDKERLLDALGRADRP